jgi:cytochrome c oxidase subunit 2
LAGSALLTGALLTGALLTVALGVGACAADEATLTAEGDRGRQVAADAGCAACHGSDGQGGVGPAWTGLAGSTVELEDGSSVTADDDYLHRAIVDPSADVVSGYTVRMPDNELSDDEATAIVAYIAELG